jgi:hypothetical protein
MSETEALRKQLLELIDGGHAHMSLAQTAADFPMDRINELPPSVTYSPWALLEHIRRTQEDIVQFILEPDYVSPPWPIGYWPDAEQQADEATWRTTLDEYAKDLQTLRGLVADSAADLTGDLAHAPGYSLLREVLVVCDHTAYHVGEFGILRQVMGTWPGDREG